MSLDNSTASIIDPVAGTSVPNAVVYLVLIINIINLLVGALGGLVPNFKALMDVFRSPEDHKRDAAKIQRTLTEVAQQVTQLSAPNSPSAAAAANLGSVSINLRK